MKKIKTLLLASSAILFLAACDTDTPEDENLVDDPVENVEDTVEDIEDQVDEVAEEEDAETAEQTFTRAELSEYDGEDGNPAYVAVDGVVYDVTDVEAWAGGEHAEDLKAGNEYTEEIMEADHGESVLTDLPIVGTLVDE